jgi:hypothetical protein
MQTNHGAEREQEELRRMVLEVKRDRVGKVYALYCLLHHVHSRSWMS